MPLPELAVALVAGLALLALWIGLDRWVSAWFLRQPEEFRRQGLIRLLWARRRRHGKE